MGSNPNELIQTKDGKYLFVAHANDNAVSVIETSSRKVIEVFTTGLFPESLAGSTPNALSLSADEKKLYIANADNNCLAVFDIHEPGDGKSLGFIPTDWYPTSVKVWNGKVWVTNGKGGKSMPNSKGPNPYEKRTEETEYIGGLFKGTLSIIPEPDAETLVKYSNAVYKNSPYTKEIEKSPSCKHAEELGLQIQWQLSDFVEEDRSLVCHLESAHLFRERAGERALFVAEQFAFDQAGRNRGAIDLHQRLVFAWAQIVNRPRDELLTGAGFAR